MKAYHAILFVALLALSFGGVYFAAACLKEGPYALGIEAVPIGATLEGTTGMTTVQRQAVAAPRKGVNSTEETTSQLEARYRETILDRMGQQGPTRVKRTCEKYENRVKRKKNGGVDPEKVFKHPFLDMPLLTQINFGAVQIKTEAGDEVNDKAVLARETQVCALSTDLE